MTTATLQLGEPIEMTSPPALAGFAGLYERHYEAVFRAALRVTGSPADAEDVLQTVFLRVLSRRDQDEDRRAAGGLLPARGGQCRRRPAAATGGPARDGLRRRAPHAAVDPALLLKEQLRRAIASLERDDATLFLLRHVEGLSNQELADEFQLEKNNVAVRLHRIRMRLQAEMER